MGCADCDTSADALVGGDHRVALAGNPNSGKTALFNGLTGIHQKTGNWPGVTVDRKTGQYKWHGGIIDVIDLPGIYSLDAASIDEQITRDYLLSHEADLLINVVDASNLERHLYLTVQLLEMNVPVIVALNMVDVAQKAGIGVDIAALEQHLGCPVLPIVATEGRGLEDLNRAIHRRATHGDAVPEHTTHGHTGATVQETTVLETPAQRNTAKSGLAIVHNNAIEKAIATLEPLVADRVSTEDSRWVTLKLLERDPLAIEIAGGQLEHKATQLCQLIEQETGDDIDLTIADRRFSFANDIAGEVVKASGQTGQTMTDRIDSVVLSRRWGVLVFLAIMYAMFVFTISFGGAFIDLFDGIAGAIFVDGFGAILSTLGAPDWMRVLLADGAGGGVQVVATFIPIVGALFFFLSFLEDSGYMARAAFVMDRSMRRIGLPGKAFVPMIVGFGCNVPAIMATRTLESERERKLTILMNPFMSCGARLPVYALFTAAFFPSNGSNIIFALYLIGILAAIATGIIMKGSLLSGQSEPFMMELPTYQRPTLRGLALRTWDRVRLFIGEAGKIIVGMVLVLSFLNSLGTDGTFGQEDSESSVLSEIGRAATPAFGPIGIDEDNWPATVGVLSGILAKEVVVGSLDAVYGDLAAVPGEELTSNDFSFVGSIGDSLATVPDNLRAVVRSVSHPFGLGLAPEEQTGAAYGAMSERFDGRIGAFAYLLFILLYFPCVATIGAIAREAGKPWAAFVAAWTTGVAYYTATVFYQGATFARHPGSSSFWIALLSVVAGLVVLGLRRWAANHSDSSDSSHREKIAA